MAVKANLRVVLHANNVVVAESEDPALWQRVLAAINQPGGAEISLPSGDSGDSLLDDGHGTTSLAIFAKRLGVTEDLVVAACDPTDEPPYIHLDSHCWEALKKNTPPRGPKSVSATVLALTLLALWKDVAALDPPTLREAAAVRESIGIVDKSPGRSLRNCEWLQERNGRVRVNPSQVSRAVMLGKAYCERLVPASD